MGPINNGQSNESRGELKVTASNPLVDSLSFVESDEEVEYGPMCEEVATRACGEDPQSLVRLRTGNSKVELSCDLQNGEYGERETTHTEVQENTDVREDVRAVETRSHNSKCVDRIYS